MSENGRLFEQIEDDEEDLEPTDPVRSLDAITRSRGLDAPELRVSGEAVPRVLRRERHLARSADVEKDQGARSGAMCVRAPETDDQQPVRDAKAVLELLQDIDAVSGEVW